VNALLNILEQYHHENMTWLRSIDFFKQENSFLKNRLAEVVDGTTDRGFLAQAEHFQNQFIIKDEFLDELRHDVNEQERDLSQCFRQQSFKPDVSTRERQQQLRSQMQYLEKEFTSLRYEFNNYLACNLQ
jgi:polyhydroxyalkanoate synthesis regulator phasin